MKPVFSRSLPSAFGPRMLCYAAILLSVGIARADTLELSATKAVEMALSSPKQVEWATAKMMEAVAGKAAAFGAFLPQISASGSYTRLGTVNNFYTARESLMPLPVYDTMEQFIGYTAPTYVPVGLDTLALGGHDNFVLRASAQQTLFTWGKLVNAYRIAGLNQEIQLQALMQARAQLRIDVTSSYYQALLAGRTLEVMKESYAQLQSHVAQAQQLYDNGLATRLDLMRARVGLTNMAAQVSQLESGASLALASLRNNIDVGPETEIVFDAIPSLDSATVDLGAAVDSALKRRPELEQLRRTVQVADLGIRIARTSNLPTAFAAFNYDYKNPVGFTSGWGTDWNFSAGVSLPLFTGGSNLARLKQAQARYRQVKVGLALAEDGIRLEVQATVSALNQEARNAAIQSENVKVAEEALGLAETRYQNGLLTNLEYMDTQLALTQSRLSYLSSLVNCRIARARLLQAMGITEEK